jgi:predicted permease
MWGRLAPGVTSKAAEQELRTLADELRRQHPEALWDREGIQSSPGGHMQVLHREEYQVAAMVGILTLLILAVACANLGGLMLARAVSREHEIGIRISIGAGRARIFRQLCTESLLLATLGSLAGLGLGCATLRIILARVDAPKWLTVTPDWRVLLFTVAATLAAALFFGLAPALQIARQRQRKTLARQILVGAQVAASCMLLIVTALLMRATQHALYTDPGFGYEQLLTIDPQLGTHGYKPAAAKAYFDQIQARLSALPEVRSVSLVMLPPLGHTVSRRRREIDGREVQMYPNWVAPDFFRTMGIPLLMGRTFLPNEKNAIVISESLARRQWPHESPIGKSMKDGDKQEIIVGVGGDAHINAISDDDAVEQYWPAQPGDMPGMVLVARVAGDPGALPPAIKNISESIDPKLFPEIRQLKLLYRDNVKGVELTATAVSFIGVVAALLSAIGIIGLVAFTVRQRTKEIAIRLALGANPTHVLGAVLKQFSFPVLLGLATGTAFAAMSSRILRKALFGVSNLDPASYAFAIAMLAAIILVSMLIPARRALKLDLAKTLHYD